VSRRQLEKILLPPQLAVLFAQPGQFLSLVAGEGGLITGAGLPLIDTGLPHPSRQAAARKTKPFGSCLAGEPLTQAELNSFLLLLRGETPAATGWVRHR